MSIESRKVKLLTHSSREVRSNKALFDEFVFIYISEASNEFQANKRRKSCHSCGFSSIFETWKRQSTLNKRVMSTKPNTFKMHNESAYIFIPAGSKNSGEVITKNSPDELVIEYINQVKGSEKENRISKNFSVVPTGLVKKTRKPKKSVNVTEEIKE